MRPRSLLTIALVGLALVVTSQGCEPNQGEGERCDRDDDCQAGLTCASGTVCCPPDPKSSSSQDCRSLGGGTIVDSGGAVDSITPTDTNDAGSTCAKGTTCTFNTDCNKCGVFTFCRSGHCNAECEGDRDCASGFHCECASLTCMSGTSGGADDCTADTGTDATVDAPADTTSDDTGVDTTVDETLDAASE